MRTFGIAPILFTALLIRLTLVIINLEFFTLPSAGKDSVSFERLAWELVGNDIVDKSSFFFNSYLISLLGSYIYSIVGRLEYVLHIIMAILGTVTVFTSYKTALIIWRDKMIALRTAWFIALFPQLLVHSAVFLRETPVALSISLCGLAIARYYRSPSPGQVLRFLIWAVVGTLFHTGVIVIIPAFIVAILIWPPAGKEINKGQAMLAGVAAVIILGGGLATVQSTGIGLGKFGGSLTTAIEKLEISETRDTAGGSAFPNWIRMGQSPSELWKIPVRMGIFITSPAIPFLVRTPNHLLGLLDALFYLIMIAAIAVGYKQFRHQPVIMTLFSS